MELFYPGIGVQIGAYSIKKGIEIETCSDAESYFDWAKIRFTDPYQTQIGIAKGDEIEHLSGLQRDHGGSFYRICKQPLQPGTGEK